MLKDAIPFQLSFKLIMGNRVFIPPFGDGSQIRQILKQLLVIGKRKNDGSLISIFVGQILYGLAHYHDYKLRKMPCRERQTRATGTAIDRTAGGPRQRR